MLDFFICIALASLVALQRDAISDTFAAATGEQDTAYQLRALGLLALSLIRTPHNTADYASMPYTDAPPFGVNTFFEQEVEDTKIVAGMKLIHDAGFHYIRQEFPWEDIEQPGKGQFWDTKFNHSTWDKYDRIVELAHENGLEVIARLDHPPDWTRHDGHARGNFAPPDNYADYADFVNAVVSRYRGKIKYYQLWNEPNIYPEWGELPVSAADYTRLLQEGYTSAKQADPGAVIISAGLAQNIETGPRNLSDLIFLKQMYDAGARPYFDILAVQDYGLFTGPGDRRADPQRTNFSRPVLLREIMVENGDANKPMWAMEVGWNAQPLDMPDAPFGRVTEERQAKYAAQAYERAQSEWPWMGVLNYWFFKRAYDNERTQPFYYFRLFNPDFTPLPVYESIKSYIAGARWLGKGFHQETDWTLDYGGTNGAGDWEQHPDAQTPQNGYTIGRAGDSLSFDFRGSDLELATQANPYGGAVSVSIDDAPAREFDLRATDSSAGGRVTVARRLVPGNHHAEIQVTKGQLRLDGIVVRQENDWWLEPLLWIAGAAVVVVVLILSRRRTGVAN